VGAEAGGTDNAAEIILSARNGSDLGRPALGSVSTRMKFSERSQKTSFLFSSASNNGCLRCSEQLCGQTGKFHPLYLTDQVLGNKLNH